MIPLFVLLCIQLYLLPPHDTLSLELEILYQNPKSKVCLWQGYDNWYSELFNPPIDFSYFVSISAAYHLFDEMESHYDPTQSCVLQVTITNLKSSVTEKVLVYLFDVYGVNELCML